MARRREVDRSARRLAEYATTQAPVVVVVRADHVASLVADAEFSGLAEQGLHLVATTHR